MPIPQEVADRVEREREDAARLATALRETTRRYRAGLMSRTTWKAHMRGLLAQVDEKRLTLRVIELLLD